MPKGTIKRLMDRGFGFIKSEGQKEDIFFHRNDLQGIQFNDLREGLEVEFEMAMGRNNRQQAVNVRPSQPEADSPSEK